MTFHQAFTRERNKVSRIARENSGAALIELGLVLPILLLVLLLTTDLFLERVAELQVMKALSGANEYAANRGCDQSGLTAAADKAIGSGLPKQVTLHSFPFCACAENGQLVTVPGTTVPLCSGGTCPNDHAAVPYLNLTSQGRYQTLLTPVWRALGATGSQVAINFSSTVRTFGSITCSTF